MLSQGAGQLAGPEGRGLGGVTVDPMAPGCREGHSTSPSSGTDLVEGGGAAQETADR